MPCSSSVPNHFLFQGHEGAQGHGGRHDHELSAAYLCHLEQLWWPHAVKVVGGMYEQGSALSFRGVSGAGLEVGGSGTIMTP